MLTGVRCVMAMFYMLSVVVLGAGCGGGPTESEPVLSDSCDTAMQLAAEETQAGGYTDTAFRGTVLNCSSTDEWVAGVQKYPAAAMYYHAPTEDEALSVLETLCYSVTGPACGNLGAGTTQTQMNQTGGRADDVLDDRLAGLTLQYPPRDLPIECAGGTVTFNEDFTVTTPQDFRDSCLAIPDAIFVVVDDYTIQFLGDSGTWTFSVSGANAEKISLNRTGYDASFWADRTSTVNPWE